MDAFKAEYLSRKEPFALVSCVVKEHEADTSGFNIETVASLKVQGKERTITGRGNGPIDAFSNAVKNELGITFTLTSYFEHALEQGSASKAAAYIRIEDPAGRPYWGVGVDTSIDTASFMAILSAINRMVTQG
jgi:2-isopropylmalate synthase